MSLEMGKKSNQITWHFNGHLYVDRPDNALLFWIDARHDPVVHCQML